MAAAMAWSCWWVVVLHRGRVMVRGVLRAGRPAPAARLRGVPRVVRSAAWILERPLAVGLGDVMASLSCAAGV
jgi:hypothetical protein